VAASCWPCTSAAATAWPNPVVAALGAQRLLVESLGGSYHSLVGENVPQTLIEFARGVDATQIVLGASRRRPIVAALTGPGTGGTVARLSGSIDVHMVSHDYAGRGRALPSLSGGLTVRRRIAGLVTAAVMLLALTLICVALRKHLSLAADVSLFLLAVIRDEPGRRLLPGGGHRGRREPAAQLLHFVEPLHTFTIDAAGNVWRW